MANLSEKYDIANGLIFREIIRNGTSISDYRSKIILKSALWFTLRTRISVLHLRLPHFLFLRRPMNDILPSGWKCRYSYRRSFHIVIIYLWKTTTTTTVQNNRPEEEKKTKNSTYKIWLACFVVYGDGRRCEWISTCRSHWPLSSSVKIMAVHLSAAPALPSCTVIYALTSYFALLPHRVSLLSSTIKHLSSFFACTCQYPSATHIRAQIAFVQTHFENIVRARLSSWSPLSCHKFARKRRAHSTNSTRREWKFQKRSRIIISRRQFFRDDILCVSPARIFTTISRQLRRFRSRFVHFSSPLHWKRALTNFRLFNSAGNEDKNYVTNRSARYRIKYTRNAHDDRTNR